MIKFDRNGLIVPNHRFKKEFLKDILKYFHESSEDE